ncbi:hypothetical protein LOTGIDRAFT_162571 [Lottia gigantea]|uniref:Uncharacterized protein n=1 Tax=Lottia gigantea TaxID=225164 RepID=V4AC19_LOTGI|nr:hypothetical protein LOTGIDRAFT_162571 [Lottia gigantea]ESO92650.1 hypothetical protein LOTGIDRAFT_162571 [Lottia gigantea]
MASTKDFDERQNLLAKLKAAEYGYQRSKEQVIHLDRKINEIEKRYTKAVKDNRKSFRYVLRQRLLVVERLRSYYDEFASRKSDEIRIIWQMLFGRLAANGDIIEEMRQLEQESHSEEEDNSDSDNE